MLPYSADALFAQFDLYNQAIRPVPVLALLLVGIVVYLSVRSRQDRSHLIFTILAAGWLWTGIVYHQVFFADLNFAAPVYGGFFVLQGVLLFWFGAVRRGNAVGFDGGLSAWAGLASILVSAAALPAVDWAQGAGWTDSRLPLIAPGATAGFTAGILMMTPGRLPWHLCAIPVLWLFIAGAHAWALDIRQDFALPAIGLVALALFLRSFLRARA